MKAKSQKQLPTFHALVEKLREMNLAYSCDTSYDHVRDCEKHGCDSICRCGEIVDFKINSLYVDSIIKSILDKQLWAMEPDPLSSYMLERLVRRTRPDDLTYDISPGYYGEELDSVKVPLLPKFSTETDEAMRQLLSAEYGWVLPDLEKAEFHVAQKQPIDDVMIPNKGHYNKLDRKTVDAYKKDPPKFATCLCRQEGPKYAIVDGYHRYMAARESGAKTIDIVWFKKEQQ